VAPVLAVAELVGLILTVIHQLMSVTRAHDAQLTEAVVVHLEVVAVVSNPSSVHQLSNMSNLVQ